MITRKGKNILTHEKKYKLVLNGKVLKPVIKRVRGDVDIKNKLINRVELNYEEGYFIISDQGINTMLWGFEPTVIILNREHYVIKVIKEQLQNKVLSSAKYKTAWKYIILPTGINNVFQIVEGDKLDIVRESLASF